MSIRERYPLQTGHGDALPIDDSGAQRRMRNDAMRRSRMNAVGMIR